MKVGEAGEAFFVFETTGEVPDELITSPLLEAIRSPDIQGRDTQTGPPGTSEGKADVVQDPGQLQQSEPDFLDLNAPHTPPVSDQTTTKPISEAEGEEREDGIGPSSLLDRATALGTSIGNALLEKERDEALKAMERAKAIYRGTQSFSLHGITDPNDTSPLRQPESMPSEPIYHDGVKNSSCTPLSNSDARERCGS